MSGIETIKHRGKVYAIIIRSGVKIDKVKFFTPQDYPLQVGAHLKTKGSEIEPHIHKPLNVVIKPRHEFIHVCRGRVKVELYDENYKKFKNAILKSGDSFLAVRGGHGFKFLGKTKLIEVKQGPYTGAADDKKKI